MYRSLKALREASAARIQSAPLAEAAGPKLVPEATLEGIRQRNALLDWLFYDIGKLKDEEAQQLSPWLAAEGAILLVPPSGAGLLRLFTSIDAFAKSDGATIRTLVVAGVGSSARLGCARAQRCRCDPGARGRGRFWLRTGRCRRRGVGRLCLVCDDELGASPVRVARPTARIRCHR